MSVSMMAIVLKFLAARRGDLVCVMMQNPGADQNPMSTLAGAEQFIVSSDKCLTKVFDDSITRQNIAYLMLVLTLVLGMIDKFSFRIHKIEQKIERFHTIVVKEGLVSSKDPELTEDINDSKKAAEAVSRMRQRDELCAELKMGSVLYNIYIGKNIIKPLFIGFCIFMFYLKTDILEYKGPAMANCTHEETFAIRPTEMAICQQRFSRQYHLFHLLHCGLMVLYALCSFGCLMFCWGFRPVTNFLNTVISLSKKQRTNTNDTNNMKKRKSIWNIEDGNSRTFDKDHFDYPGKDFVFLFDLLGHNYGLESTLKMLSHTDRGFTNLLTPIAAVKKVEINKLSVEWCPSELEVLFTGTKGLSYKSIINCSIRRVISIDNYQVTVLEKAEKTEKIKATLEIPAKLIDSKYYSSQNKKYSAEFEDLEGGTNEYITTITSVIGESRMKGERVVNFLPPFSPKQPRKGMADKIETHQAQIKWIPPFGEFTKYILSIESEETKKKMEPIRKENVASKEKEYTIIGLGPGERYDLILASVTGKSLGQEISCENPIRETILTVPKAPKDFIVSNALSDSCTIDWSPPKGKWPKGTSFPKENDKQAHTFLKGFKIEIKSNPEGTHNESFCVTKDARTFVLPDLSPLTTYDVSITSICSAKCGLDQEEKTTESDAATQKFTTMLDPARNIQFENIKDNSFTVKWDVTTSPVASDVKCAIFLLSYLEFHTGNVRGKKQTQVKEVRMDKQSDSTMIYGSVFQVENSQSMEYHFENLPPRGAVDRSGISYLIGIKVSGKLALDGSKVKSKYIKKYFVNRPQPPSNLQISSLNEDVLEV